MKRSVALRVGRALLLLQELKTAEGIDWCLHSSWASDQPVVVALVRPGAWSGSGKSLGKPIVDADLEAVLWKAEAALAEAVLRHKQRRKERHRGSRSA